MGEDSMEREHRFPVRKIKNDAEDNDFWSSPTPKAPDSKLPQKEQLPLLNW